MFPTDIENMILEYAEPRNIVRLREDLAILVTHEFEKQVIVDDIDGSVNIPCYYMMEDKICDDMSMTHDEAALFQEPLTTNIGAISMQYSMAKLWIWDTKPLEMHIDERYFHTVWSILKE